MPYKKGEFEVGFIAGLPHSSKSQNAVFLKYYLNV